MVVLPSGRWTFVVCHCCRFSCSLNEGRRRAALLRRKLSCCANDPRQAKFAAVTKHQPTWTDVVGCGELSICRKKRHPSVLRFCALPVSALLKTQTLKHPMITAPPVNADKVMPRFMLAPFTSCLRCHTRSRLRRFRCHRAGPNPTVVRVWAGLSVFLLFCLCNLLLTLKCWSYEISLVLHKRIVDSLKSQLMSCSVHHRPLSRHLESHLCTGEASA